MIRVNKPAAPKGFAEKGAKATQPMCEAFASAPDDYRSGAKTFGSFKRTIYAAKAVQTALRKAQHGKCAFCESVFHHTSYGDVEHFRPKAAYRQHPSSDLVRPGYYWLAYEWSNLFFSCQLCNQRFKKNLFPLKDETCRACSHSHDIGKEEPLLVDPSGNPEDLIEFRAERAHAVQGCAEGIATIEILGLNRSELVEARGRRLQTLRQLLQVYILLREMAGATPTQAQSKQLRELEQSLEASKAPTSEYSSMARCNSQNS